MLLYALKLLAIKDFTCQILSTKLSYFFRAKNVKDNYTIFIAAECVKFILYASMMVATQPEKKSPAEKIENLPNDSWG